MNKMARIKGTHHPQDGANFFSKVILWWIFPLLWKGTRNSLNHEDLYPIREEEKSGQRTEILEAQWREEMASARKVNRKPKLWRAVFRHFTFLEYFHFVPSGLAHLFGNNLVMFAAISLLCLFIGFPGNESHDKYFVYIYGIAFGSLVKLIGQNHLHLHSSVLGVRARAAILGLLYKKILCLSKMSVDSRHVMELVCNIFTSAEWFIPYAIHHVLHSACVIAWLFYFIGWQIIPGAFFLLALGVIHGLVNKVEYQLRMRASQLSDKRLGDIRETLTIIRSLKLNCWEEIHEERIRKTRWQEIKLKATRWLVVLTYYSFISCGQHLSTFITVSVLVLAGEQNIPHLNFFAIIALFRELSEMVCVYLPTSIRYIVDVRDALHQIEEFLQRKDSLNHELHSKDTAHFSTIIIPDNISKESAEIPLLGSKTTRETLHETPFLPQRKKQPSHVILHKVTCKLPERISSQSPESNRAKVLQDVTLELIAPGLVLVCGPVGSGKSSLLATVVGGELCATSGIVRRSGRCAFVSNNPRVFPGTIRENILFGLPYEEKLYTETIRACQLENDLKTFPQQDLAVIGEHGATVSGSQRTRISLARAVYSQADIYLLDDPLSSLDAKVAENVFRECIKGLLADRLILLTTHNPRYYDEAEHIIHLKGGIVEQHQAQPATMQPELDQRNARPDGDKAVNQEVWRDPNKTGQTETLKHEWEERKTGRVGFKVYNEYFSYGGWAFVLFVIGLVFFSGQGLIVLVDIKASRLPVLAGQGKETFDLALRVYILSTVAGVALVVLGTLSVFLVLMNAAYKVHNKMITCLLKAPLSFYANNPVERVMNRFSQDLDNLDEHLPFYVFKACCYSSPALATILLAAITNPFLIIPVSIAIPMFFFFSKIYFTATTDVKRLMSIAASSIYSHLSNTMEGLTDIRVYGRQNDFTDQFFRHIDEHHRAVLCNHTAVRWFANVFGTLSVVLATIVTVIIVYSITDSASAALGSVTILYAVNTTQMIDYVVRVAGEVNSQMTSAERILAYTRIKPERGQDEPKTPPENWPHAGVIEFKDVSLSHSSNGSNALKNISFKTTQSEKIGIAGRTGAGKSSVVAALMRLAKTRGEILIDGLNIDDFNVLSTRKRISVISQTPTLMNATIRFNLDQSGKHTDAEIWDALKRTKMSPTVRSLPQSLDFYLDSDSLCFSMEERQLLNIARVLLQGNKIVIFDGASGKIDGNTDREIERIVSEVFKACTVITIANGLSTILDCDRVMVLDQGELREFDRPDVLFNKPSGLLKQLQTIP